MALLSIVVPVYNTEKYLDECIRSILNNSFEDIELVLIDDGSTDSSADIIEKYRNLDSRVIVKHTKNQGMILARREGVLESNSQYVTFVDSDDFIDKKAYENAVDEMNRDIDVICFGIRRYFEGGRSYDECNTFEEKEYTRQEIEKHIYPGLMWASSQGEVLDPSLCTKLIKRKFLLNQYEKIKQLGISYAEDAVTIYPIIKDIKTLSIKKQIYYNHRNVCADSNKYYINDNNYYDKVYKMYAYLKEEFKKETLICEQIDKYFVRAIGYKIINLENWKLDHEAIEQIKSYETIIIYGAGYMGNKAIKYLSSLDINRFIIAVTYAGKDEYLFGNKVCSISDVSCDKLKTVVLLATTHKYHHDIYKVLLELGYKNIISLV